MRDDVQDRIRLCEQQEKGESGVDQGATLHRRSVDQTNPRRQAALTVAHGVSSNSAV